MHIVKRLLFALVAIILLNTYVDGQKKQSAVSVKNMIR